MFNKAASSRDMRSPIKALGALSIALALTGCISTSATSEGTYTRPVGNAPVTNNETPYSSALRCIASRGPFGARIAVGNIRDYTGKEEADGSGRKITQGASLMAMSAVGKAGAPLVERYDTSVTELELKYTNSKLIGDGTNPEEAEEGPEYRQIYAGQIRGSDYYLVGGITELNFNIRSGGVSASGAGGGGESWGASLGGKLYVMNIGLDLRLVDSRTLEVVDFVSYQKQIIGHEVSAGVFDFLGGNLFSLGGGESAMEPIQLAVRSVIERAVLKMLVPLYNVSPSDCARFGRGGDPMGPIEYRPARPHAIRSAQDTTTPAAVAQFAPATSPAQAHAIRATNEQQLQAPEVQARVAQAPARNRGAADDPFAYYSPVDNGGGLRGGVN